MTAKDNDELSGTVTWKRNR